ncbi:MAG: polysaccharide deacetylase family protein [Lachnospiraceae bacterium]|nr:polysaccharide deacetylase family protein [Lachnospiraceae bacterium]MDY4971324.1 polysaccharide deacetylase family protein [Lachnospiraceae bacterium]
MKKDGKPAFSGWIPVPAFALVLVIILSGWIVNGGSSAVETGQKSVVEVDYPDPEAADQVEVALTFDDGPHPVWTEKLLDGLKDRGIRATFFVIGKSAGEYPELIQRMVEDGNQVGNHTYSHVQLTACSEDDALDEIRKTQEVIYQAAGISARYIRPPFGSWNEKLQEETSLEAVLWDVDPYDWKVQNTDAVVKSILQQTEDGSIILLHDVYETSVEAALKVADIFLERGYRFCTVDEIMIE